MTDTQTTVEEAFDAAPGIPPEPTVEVPVPTVTEEAPAPEPTRQPQEAEPVDYKEKFGASTREAQRLADELRAEREETARLRALAGVSEDAPEPGTPSEALYPGFEELDEESQRNLREFTGTIERRTLEQVYKDPAIAFARETFNEKKFDAAFDKVAERYPELRNSQEEFKSKYFRAHNVPDNIETILADVAKVHLFDKAHEMGAAEERERSERIDMERAGGGQAPQHVASRTLEEWDRMRQENPAEFAKLSKEFAADMEAGKLGE